MIKIYTDGSCYGNPGPGGWAAIIIKNNFQKNIFGKKKDTTNNQMELLAAIKALEHITEREKITVFTDSVYVKEGITSWIKTWKKKNWKTSKKKDVKNIQLWKRLDNLVNYHTVEWKWVKGHSTDYFNNLVDELARNAIK